ncbi:MAG TPA: hypothetical protein VK689_20960, partial [Armatimonadota bacterium]|nr:hypothetical protein [Armatimonadota bacterium]
KWRVPREARVDEDALHSGPGEVVEWSTGNNGVPGPEPIPAPPLPHYVAELPERIIERMRNVAGVHEATVGARLPGAPGVVLDLMRQADESRLTIPTQFAAESWKELDEQMLESIQARYAVPRMIRVFGRDQEEEALAFLGSDLRGNTEVGLDSAEGVTDSIAALRQRILDYNAAGLFRMPPALQVELFTIAGEAQLAEMAGRLAERPSRAGEQAVNRGDLPPERGGAESADGLIEKISLKPEAALE